MEHKFPLGSFHRENGTTFLEIPFIPENPQWNEPKSRVPFTSQPEFPDVFAKWKTLKVFYFFFSSDITKYSYQRMYQNIVLE